MRNHTLINAEQPPLEGFLRREFACDTLFRAFQTLGSQMFRNDCFASRKKYRQEPKTTDARDCRSSLFCRVIFLALDPFG